MGSSSVLDTQKKPRAAVVPKHTMSSQRSAISTQLDDSGQRSATSAQPAMHDFSDVALGHEATQSCPLATPRTCPFGGSCHTCPTRVQAKLEVGAPDDEYEREADEVAERVMRMPEPCCSGRPDEDQKIRRTPAAALLTAHSSPPRGIEVGPEVEAQIQSLRASGGSPLSESERAFFEPRFGCDLSSVRIHEGAVATVAARSVNARAFAAGQDVVFRPGQRTSRILLAHELAHAVHADLSLGQHQGSAVPVRRQWDPGLASDPMDDPRMHPQGAPNATTCSPPEGCPEGFCRPYESEYDAIQMRTQMLPVLLAGIAAAVDIRVVPLWYAHLMGGSDSRDLSSEFGSDFTDSQTTGEATDHLVHWLQVSLRDSPPSFPDGQGTVSLDLASRIGAALADLDDPDDFNRMNFNHPDEVPGNIAGDIGKDQTTCEAGAKPSPFDDSRMAEGTAEVTRTRDGGLNVSMSVRYTVRDTVDLCPGNCGTTLEQVATVPISQFEATGISGDVPFTVAFSVDVPHFVIPAQDLAQSVEAPLPSAPSHEDSPPASPQSSGMFGHGVPFDVVLRCPPAVRILGSFSDGDIAAELYGDEAHPLTRSQDDADVIEIDMDAIRDEWVPYFYSPEGSPGDVCKP